MSRKSSCPDLPAGLSPSFWYAAEPENFARFRGHTPASGLKFAERTVDWNSIGTKTLALNGKRQ
jgi:hypothetical protein